MGCSQPLLPVDRLPAVDDQLRHQWSVCDIVLAERPASAEASSAMCSMLFRGGLFDREAIVDSFPVIIAVGEDL